MAQTFRQMKIIGLDNLDTEHQQRCGAARISNSSFYDFFVLSEKWKNRPVTHQVIRCTEEEKHGYEISRVDYKDTVTSGLAVLSAFLLQSRSYG